MTTQLLAYCTTKTLDCETTLPSDVILCVPTAITADGLGFIEGSLISFSKSAKCGGCFRIYSIEYDDALLLDPSSPLLSYEVNGIFCKDCRDRWLEYVIYKNITSGEVNFFNTQTVQANDCGDFYRDVSFDVIISPDPGNLITVNANGLFASITPYDSNVTIVSNTVDGADTLAYTICGGGAAAQNRGAFLSMYGNDHASFPGGMNFALGDHVNATMDLGYGGGVGSKIRAYANSVLQWTTITGGAFQFMVASNETTAAGATALGTNCPAVDPTQPFKWLKVYLSDGSLGYIPIWK